MRSKVNSTMVRRTVAARGPRRAAARSETGGAASAWAVRLRRTRGRLLEIPSGRQGIHPPLAPSSGSVASAEARPGFSREEGYQRRTADDDGCDDSLLRGVEVRAVFEMGDDIDPAQTEPGHDRPDEREER